jgi:hypothetical protein
LLKGVQSKIVHLMWDVAEGGCESIGHSVVVDDAANSEWPFYRGRGFYARMRSRFGLNWWSGEQLNRGKLERRLRALGSRPGKAWIICMNEGDARRAYALWDAIGRPPFVLHIMDIFHDGLSEAETPFFIYLLRAAQHVICISDIIVAEVLKHGANRTTVLSCGSDFTAENRQPLDGILRVVMSGSLWPEWYSNNPALDILASAWPEIQRRFAGSELHYAGPSSEHIPTELRSRIRDHGRLEADAYQNLLRYCHLAYLPVSHPIDSVGRYSLPSRLADYLLCGLPIVTCTDPGTAIFSFLHSLPPGCAINVFDAKALVRAIVTCAEDPKRWAETSLQDF